MAALAVTLPADVQWVSDDLGVFIVEGDWPKRCPLADPTDCNGEHCDCAFIAPQTWAQHDKPCETCGDRTWEWFEAGNGCPDCRNGRQVWEVRWPRTCDCIVGGLPAPRPSSHTPGCARWCPTCAGQGFTATFDAAGEPLDYPDCPDCHLSARATIEVYEVFEDAERLGTVGVWLDSDGVAWLSEDYADSVTLDTLDPLPRPGRDFVVVVRRLKAVS